jgi:hypothetical protein
VIFIQLFIKVAHQASFHGRVEQLRVLTADEVDEARVVIDRNDSDALSSKDSSDAHWLCTHCRDLSSELEPDELDDVKNHLRNR